MGTTSRRRAAAWAAVLVASVSLAGLGGAAVGPAVATPPAAPDAPVFTAAGDIDGCSNGADTAKLVKKFAGPVATIGDNAYPDGSAGDYSKCYDPTWGAFKDRTHPTPGNHDYDASRATPYYQYFGAAAGAPGSGWYSYDVGSWHVVALNSNCDDVDCKKQTSWLDADLTAHPSACVLAYWHHPRFTSGTSGGDSAVGAFWTVLYDHHATLVLNGHDHDYERFAPQNPSGKVDPTRGIREIVVGTGGATLGGFAGTAPNSQARNNNSYGVLEVTMRPDGYDWRFLPVAGDSFTDSGSDTCRGTAPAPAAPPTTARPAEPVIPEAAPAGPSDATDPGPSDAASGPSDTSAPPGDPAPAGRRRPPTSTSSSPPPRPHRGSAAGSDAATPGPSTPPGPDPSATVPDTAVEAPRAGTPAPADPVDDASQPSVKALTAPDTAASDDGARLSLAIAALIHPSSEHHRPDRRGLALLAVGLMAVDAAALATLRRRAQPTY